MRYFVRHGDRDYEVVALEAGDGSYRVTIDGREVAADFRQCGGQPIYSLLLDGRSHELLIVADRGGRVSVIQNGRSTGLLVESERERNARLIAGDAGGVAGGAVTAVMPGIVVKLAVEPGATVGRDDPLLVLEAMKMENEIRAPGAGVVTRIHVAPGDTVNAGDVLVEIE